MRNKRLNICSFNIVKINPFLVQYKQHIGNSIENRFFLFSQLFRYKFCVFFLRYILNCSNHPLWHTLLVGDNFPNGIHPFYLFINQQAVS